MKMTPKTVRNVVFALFTAGAALAGACSSDDDAGAVPTIDCATVTTVPSFSSLTILTGVCNKCHASSLTGTDRKNAPADINFDTIESAKAHASTAEGEIAGGDMPPATFTGTKPTDAEKTAFYQWAQCGTPE